MEAVGGEGDLRGHWQQACLQPVSTPHLTGCGCKTATKKTLAALINKQNRKFNWKQKVLCKVVRSQNSTNHSSTVVILCASEIAFSFIIS